MIQKKEKIDLPLPQTRIIEDYRLAYKSRQASVIGRREVLSGKAKFGIFGSGKEVAQLAIAHAFKKGDWRSGYYRDQTWMLGLGTLTLEQFFAQLYAHTDLDFEPATGGRTMNAHFASRYLNPDGSWKDQTELYNISADVSPTGSQMPRLVGLAFASRLYREAEFLKGMTTFSQNGNEVAWGTIGNASTAEGMFWESINAIGVLKAPAVITIYDDGYGISVPNKFQMVKENIGDILSGFQRVVDPTLKRDRGFDIYTVQAWDYPALLDTYWAAANTAREFHIPALVHVTEVTQPQGHSTSGSHERYKTKERLDWEAEFDCNIKMREWLLANKLATEDELKAMEKVDRKEVEDSRKRAWEAFQTPIIGERDDLIKLLSDLEKETSANEEIQSIQTRLLGKATAHRRDQYAALHAALRATRQESSPVRDKLIAWKQAQDPRNEDRISSHLYSQTAESMLNVHAVAPVYSDNSPTIQAFELLNHGFDAIFARDPRAIAFGEDVGMLGDVNQGFHDLQKKYGTLRVMDTGIREVTILGQAIGMAMRGLRPIAEIQYLDYLLYTLQLMSDDLAMLLWRTKGGQKAPVIVRTRGHRLEGIWHSGSPMAAIIHLVRGMAVLVPRNAVQAAGFYNTLLKSDEPGIIVEVLNGYRLKEKMPDNLGEVTVPVGAPETLRVGSDITLVTYGAMCRIVLESAEELAKAGISVEVIDVQSLLPFDLHGHILESLKKTSRIIFVDEDVPGGATAFMMQEVIEKQGGYSWLDSPAATLSAKAHRPAYGSDGDYWSKPNAETVYDAIYAIMSEVDPKKYPPFYA
ncbi:MAG: transketolase [Anaerolineales bacterium]|uniref:3-methyl-2-oxobutanoate dehydrogenase (2-methylpropanoyl-transferring) n=1 Tax=Candidatus Desulfolinea nitratireducens TaxID=2841698 RepID=A0A8J6NPI7_9CHLR|nr:transketolase [Candidatus Desulfolinea nitratireducens]MBL6960333.1 transketolase [Anaerolineales bacterium]